MAFFIRLPFGLLATKLDFTTLQIKVLYVEDVFFTKAYLVMNDHNQLDIFVKVDRTMRITIPLFSNYTPNS